MAVKAKGYPALDLFRLVAAVLVVANHTAPFYSTLPWLDTLATYGLFRVAVPFFFVSSGFFLAGKPSAQGGQDCLARLKKQSLRLAGLYLLAVALYLPLNLFAGGFSGIGDFFYRLLWQGTFYHLWYFPAAILGLWAALAAWRWLPRPLGAAGMALLYLIGLCGDNYLPLLQLTPLGGFASGLVGLLGFTRNGLFFAASFVYAGLALAAAASGQSNPPCVAGRAVALVLALAALAAEAAWLDTAAGPGLDGSLYVALPFAVVLLFRFLLVFRGHSLPVLRKMSLWVYLLHPWCIALLNPAARLLGWPGVMLTHSGLFFLAVTLVSCLVAWLFVWLGTALGHLRGGTPRALATIDLGALRHNCREMQALLGPDRQLMAVVKADAYGHGAIRVARALRGEGVRRFAVATLAEGARLRLAGVPGEILVLGAVPPARAAIARLLCLTLTAVDEAHADALAQNPWRPRVQLKIDTGMHRLGLAPGIDTIAPLYRSRLRITGIYTHFATADSLLPQDISIAETQAGIFLRLVEGLRKQGIHPGLTHLQSSYGVLNHPSLAGDCARIGLALYGACEIGPGKTRLQPALKPVLCLKARVASVRRVPPGEWAGYSRGHHCETETRVATISIGYADGLPRSAKGAVALLGGGRAAIIGVCMDSALLDITRLGRVQPGDSVVLVGDGEGGAIHPTSLARQAGTIPNELLARLGTRVSREYR